MGDNIHLGDRDGVRTPMQWSPDRNGGFSRADPAALVLPTIMDPLYGYETVNVEAQTRDRHSLLNWMRRTLAIRRMHAAFGRGSLRFLYPKNRKVLAYLRELRRRGHPVRRQRLAHAAGGRARPLGIRRPRAGRAERRLAVPADRPAHLSADPAALRLLLVHADDGDATRRRGTRPAPEPMPDYVTVVLRNRLDRGPGSRRAGAGTRDPAGLPAEAPLVRRQGPDAARRATSPIWPPAGGERDLLLAEIEVKTDSGTTRWQLPLVDVLGGRTVGRAALAACAWRAFAAGGASDC